MPQREIGILTTRRAFLSLRQNLNMPWGMTMPFSRYNTADSSLMEAMGAAFHKVCEELRLNCDREDPLTEVVITKIVELAKAGERDPEILCRRCWPNWTGQCRPARRATKSPSHLPPRRPSEIKEPPGGGRDGRSIALTERLGGAEPCVAE